MAEEVYKRVLDLFKSRKFRGAQEQAVEYFSGLELFDRPSWLQTTYGYTQGDFDAKVENAVQAVLEKRQNRTIQGIGLSREVDSMRPYQFSIWRISQQIEIKPNSELDPFIGINVVIDNIINHINLFGISSFGKYGSDETRRISWPHSLNDFPVRYSVTDFQDADWHTRERFVGLPTQKKATLLERALSLVS